MRTSLTLAWSKFNLPLDKVTEDYTSIIIGDLAYSCNKFIYNLSKREDVTVITRIEINRTIYKNYEDKKRL